MSRQPHVYTGKFLFTNVFQQITHDKIRMAAFCQAKEFMQLGSGCWWRSYPHRQAAQTKRSLKSKLSSMQPQGQRSWAVAGQGGTTSAGLQVPGLLWAQRVVKKPQPTRRWRQRWLSRVHTFLLSSATVTSSTWTPLTEGSARSHLLRKSILQSCGSPTSLLSSCTQYLLLGFLHNPLNWKTLWGYLW